MENTGQLRDVLEPVVTSCGVNLYDISWEGNGKERTLQISIVRDDGTMDLDTCAAVSEKLSEFLDSHEDLISQAYTLEVCSPGAEREIHDLSELRKMEDPYVFIRLKHPVKKMLELTGTILEYRDDGTICLQYRDKAAVRKVEFADGEIDFIRLAVKI